MSDKMHDYDSKSLNEDPFHSEQQDDDGWSRNCELQSTGTSEQQENGTKKSQKVFEPLRPGSSINVPIELEDNSSPWEQQEMDSPILQGLPPMEDEDQQPELEVVEEVLERQDTIYVNSESYQEQFIQSQSEVPMLQGFRPYFPYEQMMMDEYMSRGPFGLSFPGPASIKQEIKEQYVPPPVPQARKPEEETSSTTREKELRKKKRKIRKDARPPLRPDPHKPDVLVYRDLFQQIKNTNMPKKLMRIFKISLKQRIRQLKTYISNMASHENQADKEKQTLLMRLLSKSNSKLERKSDQNIGTKDLTNCFCGTSDQHTENRRLMKGTLGTCIFDEVLQNDNIPVENKFSYAKCLKTMEWRMRVYDGKLADRVQSHS